MIRSNALAVIAVTLLLGAGSAGVARAAREDCDAVAQSVRSQIASACPCDTASNRSARG